MAVGTAPSRTLWIGIGAGLMAGVLWGLVFLAPQILKDFTPFDITFGRFFFFAFISCLSLRRVSTFIRACTWSERGFLILLSAAGFWVYTIALAWSVQHSGGILTTLVIGTLPITIALAGGGISKLRPGFIVGLIALMIGLLVLTGVSWMQGDPVSVTLIGLVVLLAALGAWTWYALANADFLKKHASVNKGDIISLFGLVSFVCLLALTPWMIDFSHLIDHPHAVRFWLFSAVIGIGSTWVAYWLWSICCVYCPATISGPLIVSETICGLLFTFIYQQRWPETYEIVTIVLFITGSILCIRSELKDKSAV